MLLPSEKVASMYNALSMLLFFHRLNPAGGQFNPSTYQVNGYTFPTQTQQTQQAQTQQTQQLQQQQQQQQPQTPQQPQQQQQQQQLGQQFVTDSAGVYTTSTTTGASGPHPVFWTRAIDANPGWFIFKSGFLSF